MPTITFIHPALPAPVVLQAEPGETLIDVVRRADVPLYWRCGHGTCCACQVRICHTRQPRHWPWSRKERNVQARHGLIDASTQTQEQIDDSPERWRLACSLVVGEEDWEVRW